MKKICCLLLLLFEATIATTMAQVTIGPGAKEPQKFSVLEILSDSTDLGGLRMPRLTTHERDSITVTQHFQDEIAAKALGLTIYNKDTDCIEFWNGGEWISTCVGNVCPAPDMPGEITFSKTGAGPLRLNEIFTASVPLIAGMTYTWTIPSVFSIVENNNNEIKLKAITPGIHGLYNVGVTATNDCGNTSASRAGTGFIEVLNCETEPQRSDIDITKIVTSLTDGSGTLADPYKVKKGTTFTLSYPDIGNGLIIYNWNLNAVGNEHFNVVSQGNGSMTLTAIKENENGQPCPGTTIGIIASNDCGDSERIDSEIFILILDEDEECEKPDPPGPITFSKYSVLVNEILTASVVPVSGMTYTWSIPQGLIIVGPNTGSQITLRAIAAGTINLSGVSVTATNDCGNISDPTNGTGILVVKNPSTIPPGPGGISGRTCFDIAETESGDATDHCGDPEGRKKNKTDFEKREEQDPVAGPVNPDYSGVQVYTFIPPPGGVTSVQFIVDDPSGKAVEKYEVKPGNPYKLIIYFYGSLNRDLIGVTRKNAWKVHVYAIYTQNGQDRSVMLTLSLQDCACCGAYVSKNPQKWLNFMCHNLGANEGLDPFVYSAGIKGDLYQWGRKSDGHQLRTSSKVSGIAKQSSSELDSEGQVQGRKAGQFIMFVYGRLIVSDWREPSDNNLWADNSKTSADPCPPGWKVPSSAQWTGVKNSNDWKWNVKEQYGMQVGDALFLPAAGSRSARPGTSITSDPESSWPNHSNGYYWSSTGDYDNYWKVYLAHQLSFSQHAGIFVGTNGGITYRLWGQSVRCVEDLYQGP